MTTQAVKSISRGEIYIARMDMGIGSEQAGTRPVLIISSNIGNKTSSNVICCVFTSSVDKRRMDVHVRVGKRESGLAQDSLLLAEQVKTISKDRLCRKAGQLSSRTMRKVDRALKEALGLR